MLYQKEIHNAARFDLVVCGGGLTGVSAALAGARRGLKVALIEKNGFLGGVATAGLVSHILGGAKYIPEKGELVYNVGGIFGELSRRMIACGGAVDPATNDFTKKYTTHGWKMFLANGLVCDPEALKTELEEMCREAGVTLYYYTHLVDVLKDGDRITHAVLHNKSGLFTVGGTYFADTTGDADVAHLAGCPTVHGREEDGLTVPASLEMVMENVDTAALEAYIYEHDEPRFVKLIQKLREEGKWDFIYDIFICVQLTQPDVYFINTIRQIKVNGVDGDSLTRATVEGRAEDKRLAETVIANFPGFSGARIRSTAPVIGIRESRRIVGRSHVYNKDLIEGKYVEDAIGFSSYGWDMPDPLKPSVQPMDGKKRASIYTPIPFGCMVPLGVENLICAGRCISSDREALGALRVMAPCMAMGEAAGAAAAQNFANALPFAETDVKKLQDDLRSAGCILDL